MSIQLPESLTELGISSISPEYIDVSPLVDTLTSKFPQLDRNKLYCFGPNEVLDNTLRMYVSSSTEGQIRCSFQNVNRACHWPEYSMDMNERYEEGYRQWKALQAVQYTNAGIFDGCIHKQEFKQEGIDKIVTGSVALALAGIVAGECADDSKHALHHVYRALVDPTYLVTPIKDPLTQKFFKARSKLKHALVISAGLRDELNAYTTYLHDWHEKLSILHPAYEMQLEDSANAEIAKDMVSKKKIDVENLHVELQIVSNEITYVPPEVVEAQIHEIQFLRKLLSIAKQDPQHN